MRAKIATLNNIKIEGKGTISIKHTMILIMVDSKVCNAATTTMSTIKCYICGATSKDFNLLSNQKEIKPSSLQFGLSILHERIRLFESLLHLVYKLSVNKWQIKSENDKNLANV